MIEIARIHPWQKAKLETLTSDADRVTLLIDFLESEQREHLATMKRWVKIAERSAKAIAKARKLLRTFSANAPVAAAKAYAALEWRNR